MRSDAYISVECDHCHDAEEIALTATARRGYDERNVESQLESLSWICDDRGDFCCRRCYEEALK